MAELDRFHPVGTPDELEELQLSPRTYFACCANTTVIRGCRHWGTCTLPFKGKSRQAPENLGVYRESAQSQSIKTMVMPCHRYYDHLQEWQENKDIIHIIAAPKSAGMNVPDSMVVHETYEEPKQLAQSSVTGRSLPAVKHHDVVRPVPNFERPAKALEKRMSAVKLRAHLQQTMAERATRELLSGKVERESQTPLPDLPGITTAASTTGVKDGPEKSGGKRSG